MADITIPKINFFEIADAVKNAKKKLTADIEQLEARRLKNNGVLGAGDTEELVRLNEIRDASPVYVDPLFVALRHQFASNQSELKPIDIDIDSDGALAITGGKTTSRDVARVALVHGLLQLTKAPLPPLIVEKGVVVPDETHQNGPRFAEHFYQAIGRVAGNLELAMRALKLIVEAVGIRGDKQLPQISTLEYAKVFDKLVTRGVQPRDANLKRFVDDNLDHVQASPEEKPEHEIAINLPDLELTTDGEVVKENVELIGPMIFASMFDELKAFQVVDKLVEMSQRGQLALVKGKAGTRLYNYWRQAPNRMSETERQTFYAITLGLPTGPPGVTSNSEFPDLWLRLVSSVTTLARESRVDALFRKDAPYSTSQQHVKKAARDLTANMSLYGYGMAFYAAVDLQKQINEMIELLQDEELRKAFGARDMWGVIDQVAATELGGARNSSKYRMLATSGAIITAWLAQNLNRLKDPTLPIINLREVEDAPARPRGQTALSNPTDYDLVNACEMWLADSAMAEDRVEQLAQPRESPQQPSRPVQIPSFARDLLEGTGLGFEMAAGGRPAPRRGNGHANGRSGAYQGF